ncbi:MAG TPA: DNA-3-methyladenine glycosylase 2 family protein [Planctomycetota bacterium]
MRPTPAQLRALARQDPLLGESLAAHGPYPEFPTPALRRWSHYQSLSRAIVFQQLAGKAATTIFNRVCALTPGSAFPKPEEFLRLAEARLRGAGLSHNKFLALRDLAEREARGDLKLRGVARLEDAEVVERLVQVRGIGEWTAQMFLLFRLGRLDVLAPGDLGVQEGMKRLYDLKDRPTPKQVEARGAAWAPLRSIGTWLMYREVDTKTPA